jgi:peptidoglycan/xylan/chitin deacetylase (PgdA/CDA1 family)
VAVKPALEVRFDWDRPEARYALDALLQLVGLPYRFVDSWTKPAVRLAVGRDDADIRLPPPETDEGRLSVTFLDEAGYIDVPVLYDGERPTAVFEDGIAHVDLLGPTFALLSRAEERGGDKSTGRFEAYRSVLYELAIQRRPVLNYYAELLWAACDRAKGNAIERVPRWPGEADFAVALTHDVDHLRAFGVNRGLRYLRRCIDGDLTRRQRFEALLRGIDQLSGRVRGSPSSPTVRGLERTLEIEASHGVCATYFVGATESPGLIADGARLAPDPTYTLETTLKFNGDRQTAAELVRTIANRGHEVGLHGSLGSYADESVLDDERVRLESELGSSVAGIRQHYLKLDVPTTWIRQTRCGFLYDASLGFNERLGHRAGAAFPFVPWGITEPLDFLELPLTIHDVVLMNAEPVDAERALERCKSLLAEVEMVGGMAAILWHPTTSPPGAWRQSLPLYEDLLAHLGDQSVYIGTAGDLARWWRERRERLRDP